MRSAEVPSQPASVREMCQSRMSAGSTKLDLIDDPVKGRAATADKFEPAPAPVGVEPTPLAPQSGAAQTSGAAPVPQSRRYSEEPRKAVFGRLPRSLSRRLERALVELRDDTDDLTQEQLLAALLHLYVDPNDPGRMSALPQTVEAYRQKL